MFVVSNKIRNEADVHEHAAVHTWRHSFAKNILQGGPISERSRGYWGTVM